MAWDYGVIISRGRPTPNRCYRVQKLLIEKLGFRWAGGQRQPLSIADMNYISLHMDGGSRIMTFMRIDQENLFYRNIDAARIVDATFIPDEPLEIEEELRW